SAGTIRADPVGEGFGGAVTAISAPGDPDHLYVLTKDDGRIYRLDPHTGSASLFLDVPDATFANRGERGVLCLAFDPSYATTGRLFLSMTNVAGDIELREYHASSAGATFVKSIL